jgi:hypothetical protein
LSTEPLRAMTMKIAPTTMYETVNCNAKPLPATQVPKTMEGAARCPLQSVSTRGRSQLAAGDQGVLDRLSQAQAQLPKSPQ